MQPKLHKKDDPGQPVVSSVNCHTSSISKYVGYHLHPIVKKYNILCLHFMTKLNHVRHIPKESLFVTLDAKPLSTNILNNEGIKAVREAYNKHPSKSVSTKVTITFLSLIFILNKFIFNWSHYLQVMGCATSTTCAPVYANIFMTQFEATHIFMVWNGTTEELILFIDKLNKKQKTIKIDLLNIYWINKVSGHNGI